MNLSHMPGNMQRFYDYASQYVGIMQEHIHKIKYAKICQNCIGGKHAGKFARKYAKNNTHRCMHMQTSYSFTTEIFKNQNKDLKELQNYKENM